MTDRPDPLFNLEQALAALEKKMAASRKQHAEWYARSQARQAPQRGTADQQQTGDARLPARKSSTSTAAFPPPPPWRRSSARRRRHTPAELQ